MKKYRYFKFKNGIFKFVDNIDDLFKLDTTDGNLYVYVSAAINAKDNNTWLECNWSKDIILTSGKEISEEEVFVELI